MSLNLPYVAGSCQKLGRTLRSHKIRYTFLTEMTLHKLFLNQKIQQLQKIKSISTLVIDCSNCEAVYFGESKRPLKLHSGEHKRSAKNRDCEKNKIVKDCWEADHNSNRCQKKVADRESRLIPRTIKETIHSLKNPNHETYTNCLNILISYIAQFFSPTHTCS